MNALAWTFLALVALILVGCTIIAFNSAPVTTTQKDSHNAQGTNVHTFDTTISPR
jgi:outer membrane biogenesis lipoprotein LolB